MGTCSWPDAAAAAASAAAAAASGGLRRFAAGSARVVDLRVLAMNQPDRRHARVGT